MKVSATSLTLLVLAELVLAGPIQRRDNVARHAEPWSKRYVVQQRPPIQPIKPRQVGGQGATSVLPIAASDTVDPNATGAPSTAAQTTTISVATTSEATSASDAAQTTTISITTTSPATALTSESSSDVNTFGSLPFTPGAVTTDAQGQPQPVTAPAAQTTNIGGQEVTVVFVTESATFSGAIAGFTTLSPCDSPPTESTDQPEATVTLLSTTTATVIESFASGSTVSPAGAPSVVTDGSVTTVTATAANEASAASSVLSSISSSDPALGPFGVVFTPTPGSSATSSTSVATTSAPPPPPPPTNTAAAISQGGGFTTTLQTDVTTGAPLSVVPITTGVAVAAGDVGSVSTVTVTATVTVSVQ